MQIYEEALSLHEQARGKVAMVTKVPLADKRDLSLAYSPGVAEPCRRIHAHPSDVWKYTFRGNAVAVISDGSAVLGLGNIGPLAALPVMEGKAALFRHFAGIDAFPLVLDTQDTDEIVAAVKAIAPTFGGINLEDISAPRCFEIEARLRSCLDIPVFHDDQHGTAVVTYAAIINALKVVGKSLGNVRAVVLGPGSAGIAITKLLLTAGIGDIILCGRAGALAQGICEGTNPVQAEMASLTNRERRTGTLAEVLIGADIFIGVASAGALSQDMVKAMNAGSVVFAMANPDPEIMPEAAKAAGAVVVGTGRSDYPNQVNNLLGFPGIFRGALDVFATSIDEGMKVAAALAIAQLVGDELSPDYIIPSPLDSRVVPKVAEAVAMSARASGAIRAYDDNAVPQDNNSR